METFQLLHLAKSSKGSIIASAAKIILANRITGSVLDSATMAKVPFPIEALILSGAGGVE
jgi:hypothetical protein